MKSISRQEKEKKNREREILLSAEHIFSKKGYDDASMDEIAKEAQFTKRTLYQYFSTKEDLYLSVVTKNFQNLLDFISEENFEDQSGFEQIKYFIERFYMYSKAYPIAFAVMGKWGNTKNKIITANTINTGLAKVNQELLVKIERSLEKGKKDGSVTTKKDTHSLALSLMFLVTAFLNQIAITGSSFTQHFECDLDEFRAFSLEFLLSSLQ